MRFSPLVSLLIVLCVLGLNVNSSSSISSNSNSDQSTNGTFTIYNNTCTDLSVSVGFNNGSGCSTTQAASNIYGADNYDTYAHPAALNNIVTIQAAELNTGPLGQSASWFQSACGTEVIGYIYEGCESSCGIEIIQVSENMFEINELVGE